MGDDDGPGLFAAGSLKLRDIDLVGGQRDIDEDRTKRFGMIGLTVVGSCRDRDHLVPEFQPAVSKFG